MNHATETTCRLCQKAFLGNDFEKIDGNARSTLTSLNVNLDITKDDLMCVDCATIMRHIFAFKSMCLDTENRIKTILESVDGDKLKLKQALQQDLGLKDMADDQRICRFCMNVVNIGRFELLSEIKDPTFLSSVKCYIGDLDLALIEDPVICESCHNTMQKHFNFSNNLCSTKTPKLVEEVLAQKKGTPTFQAVDPSAIAFVDLSPDMVDVALVSNALCHTHTTNTLIPNTAGHESVVTQCPGFYDRPGDVNINALYCDSGPAADGTQTNDGDCCDNCDCGCDNCSCDCNDCDCGDDCDCDCGDCDCGDCDCGGCDCGDCVIL